MEQLIGSLAAFFTTVSFLPQAIKVIRTRDTSGLSLAMYVIFTTGVAFWLIYGLFLRDIPIIFANTITLALTLTILYIKITTKAT